MVALVAQGVEEPQPILLDRSADRAVEVPDLRAGARRRQASSLEVVCVIAADHPLRHAGQIHAAFHRVAAGLRDDVHRGSADFGFAEAARARQRDFLRVADVGDVGRDAAAVECRPDADAVQLKAAFVAASAGAAEHDHAGHHLHVRCGTRRHDRIRHQLHQACVRARGRDRGDEIVADRRLPPDALGVDDRRLPGDGNRLGNRTDLEIAVHGRVKRPCQLDLFAPDGVEARQRKRHGVGSGPQIDDAVLALGIGDRGSYFLDQDRARRFDGDTGQNGAGRIFDDAGD